MIWAAGNAASPLGKTLGVPLDKAGRVMVNEDLTIPGHPEVQVIGDLANFSHQTGKPLPGVSPAAMQGGQHAANNIREMIAGGKPMKFEYWDKGSLATIGRNKAVADLNFCPFRRLLRLAGVGDDPRLLPDRIPQPFCGDRRVGVQLLDVLPWIASDHRDPGGSGSFAAPGPRFGGEAPAATPAADAPGTSKP